MSQWSNILYEQWEDDITIDKQWQSVFEPPTTGTPGLSTRYISGISTVVCPNIGTVDVRAKNVITGIII